MKINSRNPKRPAEAKTSRTAKRKGDYVQRRVRHKTFAQLFADARKSRAYKDESISLDMDAIAYALRLPFVMHKSGRGKPGRGSCWVVKSLYPHPQTATSERGEIIHECAPTLEEAVKKFRARVCVPNV
jgi:hypothetical protein